ncbi:MAG: adenosine deaminase [Bifidobacterium sp.]|jgi:adenosine deaminase|nr:adenosine deaminase [Bifidobacterium sp.]MCH4175026.1 adenosine deaminase [Bifidobacterium sp.]
MVSPTISDAIRTMPKAELHLHIEGTLEPELAYELADRNNIQLPFSGLDDLRQRYKFTNLQSFLDLYYQLMSVLRTADDFRDLVLAYMAKANEAGVVRSEIFFDPQVHVENGLDIDTVLDGLLSGMILGRERYGISSGLIPCIVRDKPVESAAQIVESLAHRSDELLGLGLDSAELGYPPQLFSEVFDRARDLGLHLVAHAGEEGPADYVKQAIYDLKVERIDHGIRSVEDLELLEILKERNMPLTCCPLSNLKLQVVNKLSELPLQQLITSGVQLTINSDDPAYFGGYIADNFDALADIGFTLSQLARMGENSLRAAFWGETERDNMLKQFALWEQSHQALLQ